MKKLLMMLVVALGVSSLFAAKYTDENGRTWFLDSETYGTAEVSGETVTRWKIAGCDPLPEGDFTVPAKIGNFSIYGIGAEAFANATNLTSVTISAGIKRIGQWAFGPKDNSITTKLASVSLPAGLEYLHGRAFAHSKIEAENENTGWVQDGYLIKYTGTNETYTVPADVKVIAVYAFAWLHFDGNNVASLKQINFNDGLETIQANAFCDYRENNKYSFNFGDVTLPDSLTSIGDSAFRNANFKSLKLGKGITDLHKVGVDPADGYKISFTSAFKNASFEAIDFGDGVEAIRPVLSSNKDTLKSVKFGAALRMIEKNAFKDFSQLTNVDFTAATALESLGMSAFCGTGLSSVDLSKCTMLKEIPANCFAGCKSLRDVKFNEGLQTIGNSAFDSYSYWAQTPPYDCCFNALGSLRFPSSLKTIGDSAFVGSTNLSEVVLNDGLEAIGYLAFGAPVEDDFYANSTLTNVVIPASVTMLGNFVFNACTNLWEITGGEGVVDFSGEFGNGVPAFASVEFDKDGKPLPFEILKFGKTALGFRGPCKSALTAEDFGDINTIGDGAFKADLNESVSNLVSVAFPVTLKRIEGNAFYFAKNLSTVGFGDTTNLSIGYSAFEGTAIKELTGRFYDIQHRAFADCQELTKVDISVIEVDEDDEGNPLSYGGTVREQAFASCAKLETAVINALGEDDNAWHAGRIWNQVFSQCPALKSANVAALWISPGAFKWLEYVEGNWQSVPGLALQAVTIDVPTLGAEMFSGDTNLTAVTLGALVEHIGANAFNGCSNLTTVAQAEGGQLKQIDEHAFLGTKFYNEAAAGALKFGSMLVKWTGDEQTVTIPEEFEYIASSAFFGSKAAKVIVPESVGIIRQYTFENCPNLAQVEFKNREIHLTRTEEQEWIDAANTWAYRCTWYSNCPGLTDLEEYDANAWTLIPVKALQVPNRGAFITAGWMTAYIDGYAYLTPYYAKLAFHNDASEDGNFEPGSSYTGWIMNDNDFVVGSVTVKTGKMDKNGEVKVTMTVQLAGVKKNFTAMFEIDENGKAVATEATRKQFSELAGDPNADSYNGVYLGGTWLSGSVRLAGQDYTVRGGNSSKEALADMDVFAGHVWGAVLTSHSEDVPVVNGFSGFSISVAKKGKVKVSGTLADGQKISATAQMAAGDNGVYAAPFYVQTNSKKGGFGFVIDFYMDGESPRAWFQEYDTDVGDMTNWLYPLEFGVSSDYKAAPFTSIDIYPIGDSELFEIDPKGNGLAEGEYYVRWDPEDYAGEEDYDSSAEAERALKVSSKSPFVVIEQDSSFFDLFTDLTVDEKGKWKSPKATKVTLATEKDLENYQDDIVDWLAARGSLREPSFECVTKDGKVLEAYDFDYDEILGTYTPTAYLLCDIGSKMGKDDKLVVGEDTNFYGMKLSYAKKTGLVKGSSVYYWVDVSKVDKPKLKKGKTTISGVVIDGVIYGASTAKGVASIALSSEKAAE